MKVTKFRRSGSQGLAPTPNEGGEAATAPEGVTEGSRKVYPPVSLVLPTYNETKNLPRLIPRLTSTLERVGTPFEIIVVDDDSPDGTWALAGEMARMDPRLRVIRRRGERGLATAVVAGWKAAQGEILGVMDADLQYPPEGLPDLLEAIVEDAVNVVVASRYAPGARREGWSLRREIVSRGAILWRSSPCREPWAGSGTPTPDTS